MRTTVRTVIARLTAAAVLFLAGACASAPPYQTPKAEMAPSFKEVPAPDSKLGLAWKSAQPQDDKLRPKWWEAFGDPRLNALEERVATANPTVAQAEATFRSARAALREAGADLYPTIGVTGSASASRPSANRTETRAVQGTPSNATATVSTIGTVQDYLIESDISYEPDLWGRVRNSIRAGAATAQAAAADLQNTLLSLQTDLAVDYIELRGIDVEIRLLTDATDSYSRALQLTINRHDQGIASGADVAQARAQLETTRVQATDLTIARAQMEHAIAVLTGQPPAAWSLETSTATLAPPQIPIALPSELLERRPDIASAERRAAAANAEIGVAHAAFYPTLTLTGTAGLESAAISTLLDWPSRLWSLGAALAETAFDGGRRRAATDQAVANYDAAVAAYRDSVLTAFQQVEDNLVALRVLADEAEEQQAAVDAAEQSLAIANNQYQGGIASYLNVITAQNVALTSERDAADLLTRRLTASVELVKALGGGWTVSDLPKVR
jgi:NodT family efflux transporter outer membrane factor (OMF) lipoprotein